MTIGGLIGETFIQTEVDFRRERAMQQYNRRPHRHHRRHPAWHFHRHAAGQPHPGTTPAVS